MINIDEFLEFGGKLNEIMNDFTKKELMKPISEGKWSKYQIFLHIVDSEFVYLNRLKRVLTETEPQLPGWQQALWVDLEISEIDIENNINLINSVRHKISRILKASKESDYQRIGIHQKYGKLSFEELITRMINHSNSHFQDIQS